MTTTPTALHTSYPARNGSCTSPPDWTDLPAAIPNLRRYLTRLCRDPNDVEDALQETLIRAARYRGRGTRPGRLHAWLRCIAANVLRDIARRRLQSRTRIDHEAAESGSGLDGLCAPEEEEPPLVAVEDERVQQDRVLQHLSAAFVRLPEADRRVLLEYYAESRNTDRIAGVLDVPRSLVKVRLFRARQRLRRGVERALADERIGLPLRGGAEPGAPFLRGEA